jgi:hypothetical protein
LAYQSSHSRISSGKRDIVRHTSPARGIDDEDRRKIVVVGLLMVLFTVLGYSALAIVMKINGYPNQNPFVRFSPLALALRRNGTWSMVIPLLWAISTFISCYAKRGFLKVVFPVVLGLLGLMIPALFFYAALSSL